MEDMAIDQPLMEPAASSLGKGVVPPAKDLVEVADEQSQASAIPKHIVLLYDKLRFEHSQERLDDILQTSGIREDVSCFYQFSKLSDELFKSHNYSRLSIFVEYNDEFEQNLSNLTSFLEANKEAITSIKSVAFHIQFDQEKKWTKAPESEKATLSKFLQILSSTLADKVEDCSIINKYDMDTIYITDKEELGKLGQEIEKDFNKWPNLKTLDYNENFIRFFPGVKFPESLEILQIGGGYSLETLGGFKMPPKLRILNALKGAITSIDNVVFPSTLERLDLMDNKIYFLNQVQFPMRLLSLDLLQNRIESLRGVMFPRNLQLLLLAANPIEHIKGLKFPDNLKYLDVSYIPNELMTGVKFPDLLTHLNLEQLMTNTRGLKLPLRAISLNLSKDGVNSINPLKLPNLLQILHLGQNNIKTLNKVQFPYHLRELYLGDNLITTLKNVHFPETLQLLDISMDPEWEDHDKYLTTLKDIAFPSNLRKLNFYGHKIKSLENIEFPVFLEELCLANNGLKVIRNVRLGNNLKILDLSENNDLLGVDMLIVPNSVKILQVAEHQVGNLPGYLIERANKYDLLIKVSPTPTGYYRKWEGI